MAPVETTISQRLLQTLELHDVGVEMMAAQLRRQHAGATTAQIEQLLVDWLAQRPGAEAGDGPGRPVSLARFR